MQSLSTTISFWFHCFKGGGGGGGGGEERVNTYVCMIHTVHHLLNRLKHDTHIICTELRHVHGYPQEEEKKQKYFIVWVKMQKCVCVLSLQVVLETEITNKAALRLYENLGFIRDKRLFRYYLNGVDALRLKLWLR